MRDLWPWGTLLAVALIPGSALAQNAADKAAAESLFNDARRLMKDQKFAEACPKFEASQRLDPAPGTQLNLADCSERAGNTASAWAQFLDAALLSKQAGDAKREKAARDRAAALEPKLVRITIQVPAPVAALAGLEVMRDGRKVEKALWGSAIPVDPGKHTVEARATERKPWAVDVDAVSAGKTSAVEVPMLEAVPKGVAAPPPTAATAPPPPPVSPPSPPAATTSNDAPPVVRGSQKTWAIVAGGVGVVGVGLGAYFGLSAKSKWSDAQSHCRTGKALCDDTAASLSRDAKSAANLSTVMFAVGALGLGGGAFLWFSAPSAPREAASSPAARAYFVAPTPVPGGGLFTAGGAF